MKGYIVATFLFLGLSFYQLSGGADFEPQAQEVPATLAALGLSTPIMPDAVAVAEPEPVPDPNIVLASLETTAPAVATAAAVTPVVAAVEPAPVVDLRQIIGRRVNMRAGPGTGNAVVDTLTSGTEVEFLEASENGWVRLRVIDNGNEGWMAARYVSDANA